MKVIARQFEDIVSIRRGRRHFVSGADHIVGRGVFRVRRDRVVDVELDDVIHPVVIRFIMIGVEVQRACQLGVVGIVR